MEHQQRYCGESEEKLHPVGPNGSREAAARARMEQMPDQARPEAVAPLLAAYEKLTRKYKWQDRLTLAVVLTVMFAIMLTTVLPVISLSSFSLEAEELFTLYGLYLLMLCGCFAYPLRTYLARKKIVRAMAACKDMRVIGPLAEMWEFLNRRERLNATPVLADLLPRLRASDAALLNAQQRACLCSILTDPARELAELRIAILNAFQQVGDSQALPVVEQLADGQAKTPTQKRVREAAQACLPFLRLRAEQEQVSGMLLRAVNVPGMAPEVLLRQAAASEESAPQQLLRASSSLIYPQQE